jgi:Rab-GTPase-TBC domain
MISEDTYKKALSRVLDAERAIREASPDDDVDAVSTIFRRIQEDCSTVFPALKIFQPGGPLHDDLINITKAYDFYRSGYTYIPGPHAVAATFLVNLDPFTTFVASANALNRPLPLAFLSGGPMAVSPILTLSNRRNTNTTYNSMIYSTII